MFGVHTCPIPRRVDAELYEIYVDCADVAVVKR